MNITYSISELANEFDVTTRAIRFYEDKGLLAPRRKGTSRVYAPSDRTKLKLILRGKRLGMSLDESRQLIEMYDPVGSNIAQLQALQERVVERKALLKNQMRELRKMLKELDEAELRCQSEISRIKRRRKAR